MEFYLCPSCGKTTGHKRVLEWGTLIAAALTGGLWLLAILVYPLHCVVCDSRCQAFRAS
jgi:hypothetical protein